MNMITILKSKKRKCPHNNQGPHRYRIIKGSGRKTGTPIWECVYCHREVKAS